MQIIICIYIKINISSKALHSHVSANDDYLSTIEWHNLWCSNNFNNFQIIDTAHCRIAFRLFSIIFPTHAFPICRALSISIIDHFRIFLIYQFSWGWQILMISEIINEILTAEFLAYPSRWLFLTLLLYKKRKEKKVILSMKLAWYFLNIIHRILSL